MNCLKIGLKEIAKNVLLEIIILSIRIKKLKDLNVVHVILIIFVMIVDKNGNGVVQNVKVFVK